MRLALLAIIMSGCGAAPAVNREAVKDDRRYAVALRFEDAGEDEEAPRTRVLLVRIAPEGERTLRQLSVERGACYHEPAVGVLIAARCWWGAESARYLVRRHGRAVIALRAESAEEPHEVARLPLPSDARLDVLAPGGPAPPVRKSRKTPVLSNPCDLVEVFEDGCDARRESAGSETRYDE